MEKCDSYLSKIFPLQYHSYSQIEWQKIIIKYIGENTEQLKQETKKMKHFYMCVDTHILTIWLEKEWKTA